MMRFTLGGLVLALASCVPHRFDVKSVAPRSLGKTIEAFVASSNPEAIPELSPLRDGEDVLSLRRALGLALLRNPDLAAYSYEVRAREATTLQAGLRPNPELEVEIENIAGGNGYGGVSSAETTLQLGQLIELGGKRLKRKRLAGYDQELANWDYEAKRLDILTATAKDFVRVLAAQENVALQNELTNLADQVHATVNARVEAGKVSPLEATKARIALASARLQLKSAEQDLRGMGLVLASNWGEPDPGPIRVIGKLTQVQALPPLASLKHLLQQNPDVARWLTVVRKNEAEFDLTKARAIPDLTLKGGIKQLRDDGTETLVLGVSVPLPMFDRNQGNIRGAQFQLLKAQAEQTAAQNQASVSLAVSYQNLRTAEDRVLTIKEHILSGAIRAFEGINEGYREGKFALLDVLDAQRTLFQVKSQYLEAQTRYQLLKTDVDRLIGQDLYTLVFDQGGEAR